MKTFRIKQREVGRYLEPYIIAEIGVNHEGSLDLAKRLIEEAAVGGAHAAKFQAYKAEKLAAKDSPSYWDLSKEPSTSQFALFKKYDAFEPSDYELLAQHCQETGIDFLSTPFDLETVDFLNNLVPAFKVASADITNVPQLRKVASTGKPIILSTGAATIPEIEFAVDTLRQSGCHDLALLHCVLNYPTPAARAQLGVIERLKMVFPDCVIGYSDHVVPDAEITALQVAVLLGATIIEKHFTHDKSLPGNDHYHAMDMHDLKRFLVKLKLIKDLIGRGPKNLDYELEARRNARRSIVAAREIPAGDVLSEENLSVKRPGYGLSPIFWDYLLGLKANKDIKQDQLLSLQDIG